MAAKMNGAADEIRIAGRTGGASTAAMAWRGTFLLAWMPASTMIRSTAMANLVAGLPHRIGAGRRLYRGPDVNK
jgi:hypothetical protein